MTEGPTIIRKCSSCSMLVKQETINSGNTFGARYWTDGKRFAPMLPDQPWLVKCPHCTKFIWIDEQKYVGKVNPFEFTKSFQSAKFSDDLSFEDYIDYLSAGVEPGKKERYVRQRTWWAGNDSRRGNWWDPENVPDEKNQNKPFTEDETNNLLFLLETLNEEYDSDRLMKAEAYRELGMFSRAEALLEILFDKDIIEAAEFIRHLNQNRNIAVAEIIFK